MYAKVFPYIDFRLLTIFERNFQVLNFTVKVFNKIPVSLLPRPVASRLGCRNRGTRVGVRQFSGIRAQGQVPLGILVTSE